MSDVALLGGELALAVAATLSAGTPLAIAGLGLCVNEKAGVVNLGAEGIMLVAAVTGFAVSLHTGSDAAGFAAGAAAGALLSAGFGLLVIWLNTNQYATGLAVSLFGGGISAFAGIDYVGRQLGERAELGVPLLSRIPFLGTALFRQHLLTYGSIAAAFALAAFLDRTRTGLVLRAVGESPDAAHALGYPVRRIRLAAVVLGGALCGLAGAFLSIVYSSLWAEDMVAGRGWIALALTTFASWRPGRVILGAYLFGGVTMLQLRAQAHGVHLPAEFLAMLPYLASIAVLVLISRDKLRIRLDMPASLGKPFFPGT